MQTKIEDIVEQSLRLMVPDTKAWSEMLAEDVVVDFPYAPGLGWPGQVRGRQAMYAHVATALKNMPDLTFSNLRTYPSADPDVIWFEVHGSANVPSTGKAYEQDYVCKLRVKDGVIVAYSEYWNPTAMRAYEKD